MKFKTIPVTPFQQNCTVIWCEKSGKAAVVDPGGEIDRILAFVADKGLCLEKILLTHAHIDHAGGTAELMQRESLPVEGPHIDDKFWIDGMAEQCRMFNFPKCESFTPDRWLNDADTVTVGEETLEVLHCPGHTPGHVVFYHRQDQLLLVGDVLFRGSIGRTDFPRGNHADLIKAIQQKLLPLGDEVTFIPGHGPNSQLGVERRSNPFIQ
ncbi:MBL fold metallo-hydrolase [Neptuniibacter sp. CAU 1671]|uniref:MBL fold metallo-hydrolase n=1 Tax=Neptuniibacter sp. CAU 1671 TaxID=3032593 RepID=UPI0023DA16B8|nr:MBL fold metallo-hydrolase [Neptuniibacter sp. CAU 1671]MDF2183079.1 MBL fold metallo-hydrolase [Neptuniibacter sp. CAU 1671]